MRSIRNYCCFERKINLCDKKINKMRKEILILKSIALVSKALMWCWALKSDNNPIIGLIKFA